MKNPWKSFLNKPIRTKLNIFFTILVVVPLLIFCVLASFMTTNMQMEKINQSSRQYTEQSRQGIRMSLEELDSIVVSNLWNDDVMKILQPSAWLEKTPKQIEEERAFLENILRGIANARKDIACLMVSTESKGECAYTANGTYSDFYGLVHDESLLQMNETEYAKYNRGEIVWKGEPDKHEYVIGIKKMSDFSTLDDLGDLYIFIWEDSIRQQYTSLKTSSGSFFVVQDGNGQTVSTDGEKQQGESYYSESIEDADLGWTIQEYTPRSEIMREIHRIQIIFISVILLMLGILFLLMRWFSNYLTEPIHKLQENMREVRHENFDVVADEGRQDELGELARSFDSMTSRIKRMIEEDYQSKILIQETEYKFLRAQINPHFLYNTLDSISWMASLGGNKDVSKMSVSLGKIMRWSISNNDNIVALKEETDIVENYLSIQNIRYGETLHYAIAIEEAERNLKVPKMILQPLVENALVHGLESKDGDKNLTISASQDAQILTIVVQDNGVGMTQDTIDQIMDGKIAENTHGNHGVGMLNVHKRIRMHYGEPYGLHITSAVGEGTKIYITIPVGEEENANDSGDDCRR